MAIPLVYNARSARQRWTSSVLTIVGIAGAVGVFVAVLALARGFRATLVSSGHPSNAVVLRSGADSEVTSVFTVQEVRVVEDAPQVARRGPVSLVSPEVVVIAAFPMRGVGGDANVQVRGVSSRVLSVRDNVHIAAGRFLRPGLYELVVGQGAARAYEGLELGATVRFGGGTWTVVGLLEAGGSAFDSEVWADADVLNATYRRPPGIYQSVTARLTSPDAFPAFEAAMAADPRVRIQAMREPAYFEKQSQALTLLITGLGTLIAAVMALGAVFGALNTMYSAVTERAREVAVLRALGFGGGSVVLSFLVEAVAIALVGGVVGCLAVLPVDGLTTGTLNWQTFSHLSFAFRVTPDLLLRGCAFALVMGVLGGLPPAVRAARANVAAALRGL